MKEVKPLKALNQANQDTKKPAPQPKQMHKDQVDTMHDMLSDHYEDDPLLLTSYLEYYQPGVQKKTLKRLKQGKYKSQDIIDLHGLKVDKARVMINNFINHATNQNFQCVQIIHGKGYRSHDKGPVLKPLVNSWLRQKVEVLAFCSSQQVDGGTGAVYVLLRSSLKRSQSE